TAPWQELSSRTIPTFATASCAPPGGLCRCALPAVLGCTPARMADPSTAACARLSGLMPGGRYEKRSEKGKTNLFSGSRHTGEQKRLREDLNLRGGSYPEGDEAPLAPHLRWIYPVSAPEGLGKPGRTAEAIVSGDPGQRFGAVCTQ